MPLAALRGRLRGERPRLRGAGRTSAAWPVVRSGSLVTSSPEGIRPASRYQAASLPLWCGFARLDTACPVRLASPADATRDPNLPLVKTGAAVGRQGTDTGRWRRGSSATRPVSSTGLPGSYTFPSNQQADAQVGGYPRPRAHTTDYSNALTCGRNQNPAATSHPGHTRPRFTPDGCEKPANTTQGTHAEPASTTNPYPTQVYRQRPVSVPDYATAAPAFHQR